MLGAPMVLLKRGLGLVISRILSRSRRSVMPQPRGLGPRVTVGSKKLEHGCTVDDRKPHLILHIYIDVLNYQNSYTLGI